jgi:hypothetical protein
MTRFDEYLMPAWARTPIKKEGGLISPYEYAGLMDQKTFDAWEIKYNEEQRTLRGEE